MTETILVRYGEIALKGRNRINFEKKLVDNIKKAVKGSVRRISGRFIVDVENPKENIKNLKKVFGITSISTADIVDLDIERIKEEALKQTKVKFDTFRISVQRLQKKLKTSPELEKEIGAYIVEKTGKKVKLKNPDLEIFIEIADNAYIFTEKIKCFGGLPTGIEGKVALLVEEPLENSLLSGLLMMKRGCDVYPFSFEEQDIGLLEEYGSEKLEVIKNIKEIGKKECQALVVGQTLKEFDKISTELIVLRPLITFDDEDIIKTLYNFKK